MNEPSNPPFGRKALKSIFEEANRKGGPLGVELSPVEQREPIRLRFYYEDPDVVPTASPAGDVLAAWQARKTAELEFAVTRAIAAGVGVIRIFRHPVLGDDMILRYVPDVLILTDLVPHRELWQGRDSGVAAWLEKEVLS